MSVNLKTKSPVEMIKKREGPGWGVDNCPYPQGNALISTRDLLCVGCGICELACSMYHFGVMNKELSRIRIHKRMVPITKSIQTVCAQCGSEERKCEKACPLKPSVIHFDKEKKHMTVDIDRCLGYRCQLCAKACGAEVIHFYPPEHNHAIVCDLCEKDGVRQPQCVEACPHNALEFRPTISYPFIKESSHLWRMNPDEKTDLFHRRLYPLENDNLGITDKLFSGRLKGKEER
jgi:carbon-monoxide dehydrogenase iron sulfur subunit